jgi:hypothetical protein
MERNANKTKVSTGRAVKNTWGTHARVNTSTQRLLQTALCLPCRLNRRAIDHLSANCAISLLPSLPSPCVHLSLTHTTHSHALSARRRLMAANGDNNDEEGPFDPWTAPYDFNDVMHLLHIPGGLYPPPATAPMQSVTTGSYGCNNPFDWMAMMAGNEQGCSFVESSVPPVVGGTAMAGPSTSAHRQDVHASTPYVHHGQGVLLDCTGCQLLREIQHSNGTHSLHCMRCLDLDRIILIFSISRARDDQALHPWRRRPVLPRDAGGVSRQSRGHGS